MPRPTARVLALLELLQGGGLHTAATLAARIGVDERTIRRYAEHLVELGIPVETVRGPHGGLRIGAGSRLPPLMLTDDEALAAVLALAADRPEEASREASQAASPDRRSAEQLAAAATASAKLRRVLPPALRSRLDALLTTAVLSDAPALAPAALLLQIAEAAHDRRPLELEYVDRSGTPSVRTMLPWGLVARRGGWYVTGPDSASGRLRSFRVDRIRHARIGAGRFAVPPGFDAEAHLAAAFARAPWAHEVDVIVRATEAEVRAVFPAGVARVDALAAGAAPQGEAGWSRVRLRAERLDWVARGVVALDAPFVVQRPSALLDEIRATADRLVARLADTPSG